MHRCHLCSSLVWPWQASAHTSFGAVHCECSPWSGPRRPAQLAHAWVYDRPVRNPQLHRDYHRDRVMFAVEREEEC